MSDYPDTPANRVIEAFGGPRALARELDVDHSWVVRWRKPKPEGTDGLIPAKYHRTILRVAKANGIRLRADDLIGD
jgi:hypothetical protein